MTKARRERGPQEPAGPRGPVGEQRTRWPTRRAGQDGPTWTIGKAAPIDRTMLLAEVNADIDDIYKELDVQMKRMSQIQRQVDQLREKVKRLSE